MTSQRSSGYWYADDRTRRGVAVLNALRDYRAAEAAMRRRTRSAMRMGETDLIAIRFLLKRESEGNPVSPKDLSAHLAISSASTTVLIDRLVRSGHVERRRPYTWQLRPAVHQVNKALPTWSGPHGAKRISDQRTVVTSARWK